MLILWGNQHFLDSVSSAIPFNLPNNSEFLVYGKKCVLLALENYIESAEESRVDWTRNHQDFKSGYVWDIKLQTSPPNKLEYLSVLRSKTAGVQPAKRSGWTHQEQPLLSAQTTMASLSLTL